MRLAVVAGMGAIVIAAQSPASRPFSFFQPWITVSARDHVRVDSGEAVVRTLPGEGRQLAVLGLARLNASPERFVAWTHAIAELKRSPAVLAIQRFSETPVLADLDGLRLDDRDLDALRRCRPGNCGVKLARADIESINHAARAAGAAWKDAAQRELRRILLARLRLYQSGGLAGLPPYADDGDPHPEEAFAAIMASSPYLSRGAPELAAQLESYPRARHAGIDSFFYWSKESYGAGKPVVSITHVNIYSHAGDGSNAPAVIVAGKQIYASHYLTGALGLTMLLPHPAEGAYYLAYLNRSQLDVLGGPFGFLTRSIFERRVGGETPRILSGLRDRIEGGEQPGHGRMFQQ
jgi:hypothetical protein